MNNSLLLKSLRVSTLLAVAVIVPVQAQGQTRAALPARKYALLIGVDDYNSFSDLNFCASDITKLSEVLPGIGFDDLTVIRDGAKQNNLLPFRNNILQQMTTLFDTVNEKDLVFVAFSGHGVHINNKSYLCPADSRLENPEETMVSVDQVYTMLRECPASQKILVIDACRNDPTSGRRGPTDATSSSAFTRSLNQELPQGTLLFSSCEPGQFSIEDTGFKSGVFMHFVCKGLGGAAAYRDNKTISAHDLFQYVEYETKTYVRKQHGLKQKPAWKGEFNNAIPLAMVSSVEPAKVATVEASARPSAPTSSAPATQPELPAPDHPTDKLLGVGDAYLAKQGFDKAIETYTTVIEESTDPAIAQRAHLARGKAYLMKDAASHLEEALADYKTGGEETVPVIVAQGGSLRSGTTEVGTVEEGQVIGVSEVKLHRNIRWLKVRLIDGAEVKPGFLEFRHIVSAPPANQVVRTQPSSNGTTARQPQNNQQYQSRSSNNGANTQGNNYQGGNGYRDRWTQDYIRRNGRPPSIWQTPWWESPRDIQGLRNRGRVR